MSRKLSPVRPRQAKLYNSAKGVSEDLWLTGTIQAKAHREKWLREKSRALLFPSTMNTTFHKLASACGRMATTLRHWRFRTPVGYVTASTAAVGTTALTVLGGAPVPLLCILAPIILFPTLLFAHFTKPRPVSLLGYIRLHPAYFFLTATVLLSTLISILSIFHASHIGANVTSPEDGLPWREGLTARVWWEKPTSRGMEDGFVETAQNLGFLYEPVQSIHDANFRIWFDSWEHHCKWLTAYAFVSLDPNPHTLGSQTADIHLCKFTTPLTGRRPADYSIVAHEVAHIFAAQPHFGDGLMSEGGGNGAERFTEHEIYTMRNMINVFRSSIEPR